MACARNNPTELRSHVLNQCEHNKALHDVGHRIAIKAGGGSASGSKIRVAGTVGEKEVRMLVSLDDISRKLAAVVQAYGFLRL